MRSVSLWLLLLLTGVLGCSASSGKLPAAAPVQGTVKRADGSPVGDVLLMLQPTAVGHMTSFEVAADGTFSGEAIAGPYAWFIAKSARANQAEKALAGISEEYQRGTLDRRVTVGAAPLVITLP
jgi:hypothetical protein